MQTEVIVYLLRKTNLSLHDIGKLNPKQFTEIVKEVQRQEALERHEHLSEFAILLATISNAPIPRKNWASKSAKDFYPNIDNTTSSVDGKTKTNLDKMAEDKGIKLPTK